MKFTSKRFKKPTLLSAAVYIFMLTLVAKGFFLFAIQHPSKEKLLYVHGIVRKVRLGGDGKSTSFLIESDRGTYRYSSYYGKVWPGMELINPGDPVEALVEYYIWELIHNSQVIMAYDDVRDLVEGTEKTVNKYVNVILIASAVFLIVAYIRKSSILREK
jgi:hypothetical protein